VLRSEGCFEGWFFAVWRGGVRLDAGMRKKNEHRGREGRQRV